MRQPTGASGRDAKRDEAFPASSRDNRYDAAGQPIRTPGSTLLYKTARAMHRVIWRYG
jgi:hypothetical protein